jgi:hypothetical protein
MRSANRNQLALALSLVFGLAGRAKAANPVSNTNELVAQHLDSIASADVRAGLKSRTVQGPVHFNYVEGGTGTLDGKAVLVSDGDKLQLIMKLAGTDYYGEQFIFDGQKHSVARSTSRQDRSALGDFVFVHDVVMREGLLGGALSTAWPLFNLEERKADLHFDGVKKLEGEQLYRLSYRPHKSSDVEIQLYFDPETCRHVETVYSLTIENTRISMRAANQEQQTHLQLREKFSDFKTVDGVTLPAHYEIQFSRELQNGRTAVMRWDMTGLEVKNNAPIDARNFEVH